MVRRFSTVYQTSSFNPLDRGNLNQIPYQLADTILSRSFNPLDRGNLNQIPEPPRVELPRIEVFQSPRAGKFESNSKELTDEGWHWLKSFNPLERGNLNQI